jgi:hypothetical protein
MLVATNVQLHLSVLDHVIAWQDRQSYCGRLVASVLPTSILHLLNYQQSPKLIIYSSSSIFVNSVLRFKYLFSYPSHNSRPNFKKLSSRRDMEDLFQPVEDLQLAEWILLV